jgi:hypothetical protein
MLSIFPARALRALILLLLLCAQLACSDDVRPDGPADLGTDQSADLDTPDQEQPDAAEQDPPDLPADLPADMDPGDQGPDLPPADMPADMPLRDMAEDLGPDLPPVTALRLDAISPARGPLTGNTAFVIEGVGLTNNSRVFFGATEANVRLVDGKLAGETPPGTSPGPVNVKVLDPVYGVDTLIAGFTYTSALVLDAVAPERVPTTGGVEVTLYGRGFDAQTRISFGGISGVRHTVVTPELLRVVTPPRAAGLVDVRATNLDESVNLPAALTYVEALRLDAVRPATGPITGNVEVTLEGAAFEQSMSVTFGGAPATVISVNPSGREATVRIPPRPAGLVDVRVVNAAQDAALAQNAFYYAAQPNQPQLAAVQPGQGPVSGGTEVVLIGAGLDAQGLTITFDGQPAMILSQGQGHVVVRIPPGQPGPADIVLTSQNGQQSSLSGAFGYVADLWIDRITPSSGDVTGGDSVVLDGEGFTGATRVLFGGIPAQFVVDSNVKITATTPPRSAGVVDVVVEREQISATFKNGYTYTEDLRVFGFTPVRGSVAGNTYVEVRGRGFVGQLDVLFDGQPGPDLKILDSQTIAVRTPAHDPGAVSVSVRRGQQEITAQDTFTYYDPGARFGGAWGGPVRGAVNVTVYSTAGAPIQNAFVMLSTRPDTRYKGFTNAAGQITLSGPDVFGEQTITAVAAMHSSATVQRVNAENITIFLSPSTPPSGMPPAGPQPAIFTGRVSGLNKLAIPGPSQFQMVIVSTTQSDPSRANPDPGNGNVLLADGNYTLVSRLGDLAVVAVGGLYDNTTFTFTPLRMGIARYQFAAEGQTYTVNLDLDIPLNKSLQIKFNNAQLGLPGGPTLNEATPWLDLGSDGVFGGLGRAAGTANVLTANHLAPLTGVLADASYYVEGGSYTNGGAPLTVGIVRNLTDLVTPLELPGLLGVPIITSPAPGAAPLQGLVTFDYNSPVQPDLFYVRVQDAFRTTRWEGFLPGTARSLRLPTFPDFSNLPPDQKPTPYSGETLFMLVIGIKQPGLNYETFTYSDLNQDRWDAYSLGFIPITL